MTIMNVDDNKIVPAMSTTAITSTTTKTNNTIVVDYSNTTRDITHYIAVTIWVGWFFFYFVFTISLPILYYKLPWLLAAITGLLIISFFSSVEIKKQPKWGYDLGNWLMRKAAVYFQLKVVMEDKQAIENSGPAIFAMEPHHVLPLSIFAFNSHIMGFKGHKPLAGLTSACFKVPFMKNIYTWAQAVSIDKKNLIRMLDNGYSPVICPGGVQEVLLMESTDECVLYLNSRFGFIKLALEYGIPLVPVFSFGIDKIFNFWCPKGKLVNNVARQIGFLPVLIFGLFNLPFGPPKPCCFTNIIGRPIPVPKISNPTEEELVKYRDLYIEGISRLFETYKAEYGMKNVKLRIA